MTIRKKRYFVRIAAILLFSASRAFSQSGAVIVSSPDKRISLTAQLDKNGAPIYTVSLDGSALIQPSVLGLIRTDENFATSLTAVGSSPVQPVSDSYELFTGKKRLVTYHANKKTWHLKNDKGVPMDIIFQASNDGVAFRYYFPQPFTSAKNITDELTSYHFNSSAKAFLQPMSVSKSGWEHTNPAYEEHYIQNMSVGTDAPTDAGWVYPALFQDGSNWVLITEAALDSGYCATRLRSRSPGGEYHVGFPDPREVITNDSLLPHSATAFYTPWRVLTIGSLKTIAESTLGTDLAPKTTITSTAFIKPGRSSWSWIISKDDNIVYNEQVKFVDFAADMKWAYCLVDVNWDTKIGYDKMKQLVDYAAKKGVNILVWYNSAGDWNTVKYTPKDKLLTHEKRMSEFARLREMGVKGVKIDFFAGDGQSVIRYYQDILKDAAAFNLLVNFHGATLPRGWSRTYPQLVTTEAVRGFEMVTFNQDDADAEPNHCAMLPFARNAFDPMDFTPTNLYKIPTSVIRKTSGSFELALTVLFLSGIQHIAESPEGMSHVPPFVKSFMQTLPNRWDDVRFIDGFPGRYAVIARRAGNKWYIGGINGENAARNITIDLKTFGKKKLTMITDGNKPASFVQSSKPSGVAPFKTTMQPNGGFVIVLE